MEPKFLKKGELNQILFLIKAICLKFRNLKPLNLNEITQMSEKDPRKIQATKLINQLKSICRGHFARCQYKKIRFINIVLGKKAHQISK